MVVILIVIVIFIMVIIVIVTVIVIMVLCCTCEPTVSRANKPCLIIILPPSSLSGNIAWSTILIQHHFQQYYHQQCLDYPQDSWYPVSLEFLTDLWIPNVFIYNLKSFQSIAVLKRLAGESKRFFPHFCGNFNSQPFPLSKFFFEAEFERPPYYYGEPD